MSEHIIEFALERLPTTRLCRTRESKIVRGATRTNVADVWHDRRRHFIESMLMRLDGIVGPCVHFDSVPNLFSRLALHSLVVFAVLGANKKGEAKTEKEIHHINRYYNFCPFIRLACSNLPSQKNANEAITNNLFKRMFTLSTEKKIHVQISRKRVRARANTHIHIHDVGVFLSKRIIIVCATLISVFIRIKTENIQMNSKRNDSKQRNVQFRNSFAFFFNSFVSGNVVPIKCNAFRVTFFRQSTQWTFVLFWNNWKLIKTFFFSFFFLFCFGLFFFHLVAVAWIQFQNRIEEKRQVN